MGQIQPDWRRIGSTVFEAGLASSAGGPVERVAYSADGSRLRIRTASGRGYETADFETWAPAGNVIPDSETPAGVSALPERGARLRAAAGSRVIYAFGRAAYRSEDNGASWRNLTEFRGQPLLGGGLADLAVSPRDADEIVAAGRFGVWRSVDGGMSWTGLNEGLPNLPVRRLLRLPGNGTAMRIELNGGSEPIAVSWTPGEHNSWAQSEAVSADPDRRLREALGGSLGSAVTALAAAGDFAYAGGDQGRLWASSDRGASWRSWRLAEAGTVRGMWTSPADPRLALAALEAAGGGRGARVVRTINAGLFWDDVTADLPPGSVYALAADLATGAVYAASDAGVFLTYADLVAAGPATGWTPLRGRLPDGPVLDLRLDEGGNQLWVAVEGYGVYAALAPHRFRDPRVVNAADWSSRPAAPGALLSVLGSKVSQARVGSLDLPVLGATEAESQIQVPFEATGSSLNLALLAAAADGSITRREMALALRATSPAIFLDRDGAPMVLDADRGVLLDAGSPARAGARVQILATGLGRVAPEWPTGLAAPLDNPPRVVAPVRVYLDRMPLEVNQATLAPGYVGFYLIEVQMPDIVNAGRAELYLEVGGQSSGRVSLMLAQ